jgi:hypothetical protein
VELPALLNRFRMSPGLEGLRLTVLEPAEIPVVDYSQATINLWLSKAERALLRSLEENLSRREFRHLGDFAPREKRGFTPRKIGRSFIEVLELAKREQAGESLSEEEEAEVARHSASFKTLAEKASTSAAEVFSWQAEERSPEQFKDEIAQYLDRCRAAMPKVIRLAAGENLPRTRFAITNETHENYSQVRVIVHIPGDVEAVPTTSRADNEGRLPAPPRPFGRYRVQPFGGFAGALGSELTGGRLPRMTGLPWRGPTPSDVAIRNGGSTTLTFSPVDLRPLEADVPLAAVVLLPQVPAESVVAASWEATSLSVRGVARGAVGLNLGTEPLLLRDLLND